MKFDVRIESKALFDKLKKLNDGSFSKVQAVVRKHTDIMEQTVRTLTSIPATGRARKNAPPRKLTGRLQAGIRQKVAGLKGLVTVDAQDSKGRRYPFMLESGTEHAGKHPFIKKAQRKTKPGFVRDLVEVARKL